MGKVIHVKKSRKEYKCSKCGEVIPKGSEYLKGELNFQRPIIRCCKCGLAQWEVTTSDYLLRIGRLMNEFESDYDMSTEDCQDEIAQELEDIASDLQDRLDNMPESLHESDAGMTLQSRIESCESAADEVRSIEVDEDESEESQAEERSDQISTILSELEG